MITGRQMAMARIGLRLGTRELAAKAGITPGTISRYETEKGDMHAGNMAKIIAVFEESGVEFVPATAEKGVGVFLPVRLSGTIKE